MAQRTPTLDELIDRLQALRQTHGGKTFAYIADADSEYSLGITRVEYETRDSYGRALPPGVYFSGAYDTEEV